MNVVWTVFAKELIDAFRDRRSLVSALVFPLFGPIMVVGMMNLMAHRIQPDGVLEVPVVGAEYAPGLMAHLRQAGVKIQAPPADPEQALREDKASVVLVVPEDYGKRFREGRSVVIEVLVDSSDLRSKSQTARLRQPIAQYAGMIGALRLIQRGIDPQLVRPVTTLEVDVATPKERAGNLLSMIPMFSIMALFMGGMYLATDATAGERERGSLEPLLSTGISRWRLVLGKWLATACLSNTALLVNILGSAAALRAVSEETLGAPLTLSGTSVVVLFMISAPLTLLSSSSQMLVASFAKSFREAQSYLSGMMLLPMIPGILFVVEPPQGDSGVAWIPVLGQQAMMMDVLVGRTPSALAMGLGLLGCILLSLAICRVTAWLLTREKIVFGG